MKEILKKILLYLPQVLSDCGNYGWTKNVRIEKG